MAEVGECPVCYEPMTTRIMATSPCGHFVCLSCLLSLRIPSCPLCRMDLTPYLPSSSIHRVRSPPRLLRLDAATESEETSQNLNTLLRPPSSSPNDESIYHLIQTMRERNGILITPLTMSPPASPPGRSDDDVDDVIPPSPPSPFGPTETEWRGFEGLGRRRNHAAIMSPSSPPSPPSSSSPASPPRINRLRRVLATSRL